MDERKIIDLGTVKVSNELAELSNSVFEDLHSEGTDFLYEIGLVYGKMAGLTQALCEVLPYKEIDAVEALCKVKSYNTRFLELKTKALNEARDIVEEYYEYADTILDRKE